MSGIGRRWFAPVWSRRRPRRSPPSADATAPAAPAPPEPAGPPARVGLVRSLRLPWPARTRLTLWYVALLAGSFLLLGAAALWAVRQTLEAGADEQLRARAAAVLTEVDFERGRLEVDINADPEEPPSRITDGLAVVRVWDRGRRAVFRQDAVADVPDPDRATLQAALAGDAPSLFATVRTPAGDVIRTLVVAIDDDDRVVGVLQVGRSLADVEAVMARLRALGLGGLAAVLALGWAGGSFLAGRALAPVDRITRAAEAIGAANLAQRLDLRLPDDELGRLAGAFDGMIGRLDRAFQRQRRFTADASHELRTPLAVIRSQVEVALGRDREPAYYRRVLASVHEEAERLERLTENLLTLARAENAEAHALAPLDLEELVDDVVARVAPGARVRGVQLGLEFEPTGELRGDAVWIGQLLLNLLDNAVRHTPAGGSVGVSLRQEGAEAVLRVTDTGEGIAPEHLPHIFERFYRADPARTQASGGAGLGLAICAWVARLHGGGIEADSALGRGTTVTVRLPAGPVPAPADPGRGDAPPSPGAPPPSATLAGPLRSA